MLHPGKTYLGSTVEYTETRQFVPFLEGKSSVGRLGIDIHATAGGMWDSVIIGLRNLGLSIGAGLCRYAYWPVDLF